MEDYNAELFNLKGTSFVRTRMTPKTGVLSIYISLTPYDFNRDMDMDIEMTLEWVLEGKPGLNEDGDGDLERSDDGDIGVW